jgi:microcystin-dependent protein
MNPFIGTIIMFAGTFAPRGWALCDGTLLAIAQNQALFSLLGTTYGGNGTTTFALPDLRGRAPMHAGQGPGLSPRTLGELGGAESRTLLVANMPAHNHIINVKSDGGSSNSPANNYFAGDNDPSATPFSAEKLDATMNQNAVTTVGGSQPFPIMSPYQVVNFIIATEGIYPSRD